MDLLLVGAHGRDVVVHVWFIALLGVMVVLEWLC